MSYVDNVKHFFKEDYQNALDLTVTRRTDVLAADHDWSIDRERTTYPDKLAAIDLLEGINKAYDMLFDESDRLIIKTVYIEGNSYKKVCKLMGISQSGYFQRYREQALKRFASAYKNGVLLGERSEVK